MTRFLLRDGSIDASIRTSEVLMQVAIYARVSTKDKGQDTENQLRQLREFCRKQDWAVVHEYIDKASGKRGDREQFQAMFAAASRREFDCVLFWSLDRFSREGTLETLTHLQRLTACGVAFKSFTEQYLDGTGMFRDAIIGILAALAKQERVRLSERVQAGLQRAKAQGRVGGRPKVNRAADPEAKAIRQLREDGQSYGEIASELGRSKADVYRVCVTLGCIAP
jgi:DNA invertase Pin-like site-specific DNA recombinase